MSGIGTVLASMAKRIGERGERFATGLFAMKSSILFVVSGASTSVLYGHYFYNWGGSMGPSMYPTLPEEKHIIILAKQYARGRGIQIGDVIQARHPMFPDVTIGKRVIGLPGDYVVRDPPEAPNVGGAPVPGITDWERRLARSSGSTDNPEEEEEDNRPEPEMIQVPEGHVWVQGDNMAWSRDSRFYGPLPMGLILAKSVAMSDGAFRFESLTKKGRGLRKVEEWEEDAVLGNTASGRAQQRRFEEQKVTNNNKTAATPVGMNPNASIS